MDFSYSAKEDRFRQEARTWIRANLPQGWGKTVHESENERERYMFRLEWEKRLYAGGWAGLAWPREYGGAGATLVEQAILAEELASASAPEGLNIIGRNLTAPTLMHHGTEAQRQRFLPKILSCEEVWCQGFSEPNAGSDLASVRTTAVRDGDEFVVNGQKVWTSFAQYSHWCFMLVRTDPAAPKHKGISFLLVDLQTPGITVRPLRQISGESEFNETFFDNVRVPVENLVGGLNEGWKIAMTTLAHERGPEDALARQIRFKRELGVLLDVARSQRRGNRAAVDDASLRQKLATSVIEIELMRLNCLRSFSKMIHGKQLGPESSFQKLYWSHVAQRMYETALETIGPEAALAPGDPAAPAAGLFQNSYLQSRAFTIYSGTSEIQRNIIAERVLGLPKSP